MAKKHQPLKHPIIYVRGFAATQDEIEDTVADPYCGFNVGSSKARKEWTGEVKRFYFESPLVRLMHEHGYADVYVDGEDLVQSTRPDTFVPYKSIVIHRYYDDASRDFGSGKTPAIEHFAKGLNALILRLKKKVCGDPKNGIAPEDFRVYLVAHSMGGLICRAFLQNTKLGSTEARGAVDKVFTYATPHNGIDLRIVRNIPAWLSFGDVNNFSRARMADYLALPSDDDVSLVTNFPPERIFNLVGTNPQDYAVARGLSSWAVGDASDGLVRIENAVTYGRGANGEKIGSPRAFVHRSHSGHYGIVNSEEGYQNLTRFLFGSLRVDGMLDIDEISLPVEVEREYKNGKRITASYQFEVVASVRRAQWQMTRREVRENSAIFRRFDDLFPKLETGARTVDRKQSPHLFSIFLDPTQSAKSSGSVSFAFDLKVLVPDYQIDGVFFDKRHFEGGYILRDFIIVEAFPDENALGGWRIKYGFQSDNPGKPGVPAKTYALQSGDGIGFDIEIAQRVRPGMQGTLRLEARPWS